MQTKDRLLIIESVLSARDESHPGKLLDLVTLTVPGGVEPSSDEYNALLTRAGSRITCIVRAVSAVSIVEAVTV
jgi:hypothetical protein